MWRMMMARRRGGGGRGGGWRRALLLLLVVGMVLGARGVTNNMALLNEIFGEISNAGSIGWPLADPCGSGWEKVQCSSSGDVITMFLKDSGLEGTLSGKIAQLPGFTRLDAQNNNFTGAMPSFANVKTLTTLFLANNRFTSIPADFFDGLVAAQVLSLDNNPALNGTAGWRIPAGLAQATALQNLTMSRCNVVGSIPDFIGTFGQLSVLNLGGNGLSGGIPETFSSLAGLTQLKLNGQGGSGGGLTGPITVVGSIPALNSLWLQQNSFSGIIPEELGNVLGLTDVELNDNELVGTIPASVSGLSQLKVFNVQNNKLVGQIPSLPGTTVTYDGNNFCSTAPGVNCSAQTTALLAFLAGVNFPSFLSSWGGADPCTTSPGWLGVSCSAGVVNSISLVNQNLTGTLSASLGDLQGLTQLKLSGNHFFGTVPASLAALPNIKLVDLSNNNFSGPVPRFPDGVLLISGNPLISDSGSPPGTPSPPPSPPGTPPSPGSPPSITPGTPQPSGNGTSPGSPKSSSVSVGLVAGSVVGAVALLALIALCAYFVYRRKRVGAWRVQSPNNSIEPHGESDEVVKIVVGNGSPSESDGRAHSGPSSIPVEGGNFIISMQILREVTNNFSDENILGRGGFGVVYKGELGDGTKIAVKRMEAAAVSNKGMDEFQAEIQVLTKVRHRHLVGLLGYCVEGNEKLLVYEYMPQGTLSQHLFEYARYECKPLTWKQRLVIALDVARGIEYLHGLAHKSFIHRDLKPSNILLGDDLRAKVSDFGLVKLAPEGKYSVETRLAGTFGYLAPEYAVTGRVTTKADVFSFGVILMELITGRKALDETQSEENVHLVTWFKRMNMNKEALQRACDISIELSEETFQSITTVAELAGHCTAREPYQRPDMGHAVNVLAPLVERWKPTSFDAEDSAGIDLELTLPQALKRWQAYEDSSVSDMDRTEASLPNPPTGFVDSFTSADGR